MSTHSIRNSLSIDESVDLDRDALALRGSIGTGAFYAASDTNRIGHFAATALRPSIAYGMRGTVESAVYSSYGLRASLHDVRAPEKTVWRELLRFTPVIGAEFGSNLAATRFDNLRSGPTDDQRYASLAMTLPLLTGGERYFGYKSARSTALSSGYGAAATRDNVVLDTVGSYLQHIYARKASELYTGDEGRLLRLLAAMKAQRVGGFVSGVEVAQVQAELDALQLKVRMTYAICQILLTADSFETAMLGR